MAPERQPITSDERAGAAFNGSLTRHSYGRDVRGPTAWIRSIPSEKWEAATMAHDARIVKHEDEIAALGTHVPDWIATLSRPMTPAVAPAFGPLQGIRVVSTGIIVAQPYI